MYSPMKEAQVPAWVSQVSELDTTILNHTQDEQKAEENNWAKL